MNSLYEECVSRLNVIEDSEEAVYAFAESALYLIGASGAFEYQKVLKPFCSEQSAKCFRLSLCEHRYTCLNLKLFTIAMVRENASHVRLRVLREKFEVSHRDAALLHMLFRRNTWFRGVLLQFVSALGYSTEYDSVSGVLSVFNRVFPAVFRYIKFLTYKKLRFLVKSTNSSFDDFHSDLSAKVVHSFYSLVPVDHSDAHLTNYLKRAVHNHVVNLIKSHTTQKRGRLVSTGVDRNQERQFSLLCVSQNQMAPIEDGGQPDVDGTDTFTPKFELQFSISQVLDRVKRQTKKYKFMTLLLGEECAKFSAWLREKSVCREQEDNVDVQSRVGSEKYTSLVAEFLNVPREKVDSFFGTLRTQLEG